MPALKSRAALARCHDPTNQTNVHSNFQPDDGTEFLKRHLVVIVAILVRVQSKGIGNMPRRDASNNTFSKT